MAWIESHQTLRDHTKTKRAARALGLTVPAMIGHLHCLWWWAIDNAPDGNVSPFTDDEIADAALYDGDAGAFCAALIGCRIGADRHGFIEQVGDCRYIHDWDDFAGKLLDQRQRNAEKQARYRERHRTATDTDRSPNRHVTVTLPDTLPSRNRATVPNLTVPDSTVPPPYPPLGVVSADAPKPTADEPSTTDQAPSVGVHPVRAVPKTRTTRRYSADFETLWTRYPQSGREDKAGSYAEYQRQKPDLDELEAGLIRWEASDRWARGMIVGLKKFLKERRWEATPEPAGASPRAAHSGRPLRNPGQEAADAVDRVFDRLEADHGDLSPGISGRLAIAGGHVASQVSQSERSGDRADDGRLHAGPGRSGRSPMDGRRTADAEIAHVGFLPGRGRAERGGRDGA